MSATGEDELICDFAEYYHVLNWRELPIDLSATLATGLPGYSRSKMKMSGERATVDQILLAKICDLIAEWNWAHSKSSTRPPSLVKTLTEPPKKPEPKHRVFKDSKAFLAELSKYVKGGPNDG